MNDQERDKTLEKIDTNVDELLRWKSALDVRCAEHRKDTTEVRTTIYGNPGGADGLQFDVSRLLNGKANIGRWRDFLINVLRIVVASGIIGAVVLLIEYFKTKGG